MRLSRVTVERIARRAVMTAGFLAAMMCQPGYGQSCDAAAPAISEPSNYGQYGRWIGPFIFHSDHDCDDPAPPEQVPTPDKVLWRSPCASQPFTQAHCLAHMMVVPLGPKKGSVLFMTEVGQVVLWEEANPDVLDSTVWCNESYQGPASAQWEACKYQVFCSGHTTDRDGNFIFMGGAIWPPPPPQPGEPPPPPPDPENDGSCAISYFDPTKIGEDLNPWTPGPNMLNKRWYGTVVTMLKAFDGRPFIIGGSKGTSGSVVGLGTRDWEKLNPTESAAITTCDLTAACSSLDTPPSTIEGPLNDSADLTKFEYYPRVHQLTGQHGEFFIAGDTQPSFVNCDALSSNLPGQMWFLRPPTTGATSGDLKPAPFTDDDGGVPMNRYYGSSVMLHQLPENGGPNRVLIFGGSNGCIGPGVCDCPPSSNGTSVQIRSSVKELKYVPGAQPGGTSELITKEPLKCGRVYSNAVILPTGEIFISRGAKTDPYVTTEQDDAVAHLWGEIYNPGPSNTSPGSSEWTAKIPSNFANWTAMSTLWGNPATIPTPNKSPPRIYHHLAMLLPSGRVLVAGGDEVPGTQFSPLCGGPVEDQPYGSSSFSGEIYEPPYFHKDFTVQITSSASTATFTGTTEVGVVMSDVSWLAYIDRAVFIRTGSLTHHQDASQVYVEAQFDEAMWTHHAGTSLGTLTVNVPRATYMPPGYYMLFVVGRNDGKRVPSQGVFIKVD